MQMTESEKADSSHPWRPCLEGPRQGLRARMQGGRGAPRRGGPHRPLPQQQRTLPPGPARGQPGPAHGLLRARHPSAAAEQRCRCCSQSRPRSERV